ncbi:hypothetical protein NM688_g5744 [Phlebia brevispora]|uniref:Uncharacterized protein n=1 Tax=Phlebia brevispora TaxID=194682 RepID=A0ACC1SQH0_9APHY|nr:hypothetical protein NM688_g5744 [Phlebia brevispora]
MESVHQFAEREAGKAANGFHQTDVSDLTGRTAIVTGGSGGIGYEVARALALANARVLILSRKEENAEGAIAEMKEFAPSGQSPDITFVQCDLGNLKDVKAVADKLREQEKRMDLVICDAGVGVNSYAESADSIDRHMAVNHLGHFLLVNRILPVVRKTAALPSAPPPRIISVSSELHRDAPSGTQFASLDELNDSSLRADQLYGRSKLANILFTKYGLEDRVFRPNGDRIIALSVHPGAVHTGQQDQFKEAYGKVFGTILKLAVVPFMRNPDQGSLSTLWAATSEDVEKQGWEGRYFSDPGKLGGESKQACDPELGASLWKLSEELIKDKIGSDALLPWDIDASRV